MCNESNCKHDPFDFSDLEDMDGFNAAPEPVVISVEESIEKWNEKGSASAQGAIYEEKCKACRGRGRFISWAGRDVGPCFKCDGTGVQRFKTSPEQREKNRERAAAKKQAKLDAKAQKAAHWIAENEEMFLYLCENSWNNFYASMVEKIKQYGGLTEGQYNAVKKGMDKAAAKAAAETETKGEALDISSLNGRYAVPNGDTRLKVAVRHARKGSKWEGWIFVDDGAAYGARRNYGRQAPGGTYDGKIVDALKAILADPKAATIAYGKLTGTCGVCGRLLEDEDSIEAGIGPVCARKF